jgi:hypothetical protein
MSSIARAEPTDQDKALATTLFVEAKQLLADGKVADACRKLEESRRLDPLPGTVLNLAVCHEREGLTASAWAEFRDARVMAQRDHRDDRVELADQHLKDLEPRLSWLVIVVPTDSDAPGLEIARDGTVLGRAAWGTRIPVDPGEHVVAASARGKKTARMTVKIVGDGAAETVTIPPLEDEPIVATPPPPPIVLPPADVTPPTPSGLSTRRTFALVAAGVGVVGVGLGTYFGIRAISKHNDDDATCKTDPCPTARSLNDDAKSAADVSTISFAVGLVGLAAGAFLWFGDSSASVSVTPSSISARGRF